MSGWPEFRGALRRTDHVEWKRERPIFLWCKACDRGMFWWEQSTNAGICLTCVKQAAARLSWLMLLGGFMRPSGPLRVRILR